MRRDMQQVLERWGRWAAREEYCSMVDWPAMSVLPSAPRQPAERKPVCTDEDGAAVDTCVAHMSLVCPRDDVLILGLRFIGGLSTRLIADAVGLDRNAVRSSLRASEAFLEGCMHIQGLRLDMDPEVQIQKIVVGTQKPMLIF